jgi:hypothetical protein
MAPVTLGSMTPAQEESWRILLDLYADFPDGWCLIGGQMVWLLANEHNVDPIRATDDVDVAVDIRTDQQAIRRLCIWLGSRRFELEGTSTDGIGHRYLSSAYQGPGRVLFDVLAPDNVGERADLTTSPPARTVSAPGSRAALDAARPVQVAFGDQTGHVLCPSLLTAILAKGAATTIPVRENRDRDWVDAAFLLSLVPDPVAAGADISSGQRRGLRVLRPLLDENHRAWRSLGERSQLGNTTLRFLLDE